MDVRMNSAHEQHPWTSKLAAHQRQGQSTPASRAKARQRTKGPAQNFLAGVYMLQERQRMQSTSQPPDQPPNQPTCIGDECAHVRLALRHTC
jgi:hypothetical protein